jgi:hypothetical protein
MTTQTHTNTDPPAPKPVALNTMTYAIALAAAIGSQTLRPPLFFLLNAVAWKQGRDGSATTPWLAITLGVTFQAIDQHLKKHEDLLAVTDPPRNSALKQVTLTPAGVRLLKAVQDATKARLTSLT